MSRRYFDKNFDILLRPEKKQVMLEKFSTSSDYAHFLDGKRIVDVFTSSKEQLEGTLELKAHGRVVFKCMTPGMPQLQKGSLLLLIPEKEPQMILVQAAVEVVMEQMVMLENVDPRRRARYRTRMVVSFYGVARPAFDHLKNHTARAFRQDDTAKDRMGKTYIAKVHDRVEDYAKIPHDGHAYVGKGKVPHSAVMADISEGGCCLYIPREMDVEGLADSRLIFVTLELPLTTKRIEVRIFASVRSIRNQGDNRVLHCMFVEPLPAGILDF